MNAFDLCFAMNRVSCVSAKDVAVSKFKELGYEATEQGKFKCFPDRK